MVEIQRKQPSASRRIDGVMSARDEARRQGGELLLRFLEREAQDPLARVGAAAGERDVTAEIVAGCLNGPSPTFDLTIVDRTMAAIGQSSKFAAAVFAELQPRDGFEKLLVSQIAMTHTHIQTASVQLRDAATVEKYEAFERAFARLSRTYVSQMEALRKHRTGGTQTVKHVHVNDGGQAIVADTFSQGGR